MLTFLIDTSTERGLVAVANGLEILGERALELRGNQNHLLFPAIQGLFETLGLSSDNIQRIGVGTGPGSYTGIRVAATVAMVLSFSRHIPLVGIPTLKTFQPIAEGSFAVVIDARIGGFYVLFGEHRAGQIRYVTDSALLPLDRAGSLLEAVPLLISPYPTPVQRRLSERYATDSWVWKEQGPSAHRMAALVEDSHHQGCYTTDGQLDLLYLRKTQAELEKLTE